MDNEMRKIKIVNLDEICRFCLTVNNELISIFNKLQYSEEEKALSIHEILTNVLSYEVLSNDDLPTVICENCLIRAQSAYNFKNLCKKSEDLLRNSILILKKPDIIEVELKNSENSESNIDYIKEEIFEPKDTTTPDLKEKIYSKKKKYCTRILDNGIKCYSCPECNKEYKSYSSLTSHIRTHSVDRPFVCNYCGKTFIFNNNLQCHLRSHTNETPYVCEVCGKKYRQHSTLIAHRRVHTGQKPFVCKICGKGFRQSPDLGYHMRTHTKEKPFMCTVCGKRMSMKSHLTEHMRSHTGEKPYQCEQCGKSFSTTSRLKRHVIIHSGKKPYTCDTCNKTFNRSSTLKTHLLIHNDKKKHICKNCGKSYNYLQLLKMHLRNKCNDKQFEANDKECATKELT